MIFYQGSSSSHKWSKHLNSQISNSFNGYLDLPFRSNRHKSGYWYRCKSYPSFFGGEIVCSYGFCTACCAIFYELSVKVCCCFFYLPAICWQRIAFEFLNNGLALVGVGRHRYILENKKIPSLELVRLDFKYIFLSNVDKN